MHIKFSPLDSTAVRVALMFSLLATLAFAQSGDISGSLNTMTTLGSTILKWGLGIACIACACVMMAGFASLGTAKTRGLGMIVFGLIGALGTGLAIPFVNTLTGQTVG